MIQYTVSDLISIFEPTQVEGTYNGAIVNISSLESAKEGDLSFLATPKYVASPKYKAQVASCNASVILLPKDYQETLPGLNQLYIRVDNASVALAKLCKIIEDKLFPKPLPGIHPSSIIDSSSIIDPTAYIGPLCVIQANAIIGAHTILKSQVHIGAHCRIDENCYIMPHVSILDHCTLGKNVRVHSGCVVGSDGYGYEFINNTHQKVPQIGNVVVEEDVELGANTTIDRARFGETIIKKGTKIDNLVQIAHNVRVGRHCLIVSQVGISGSTILGDYVVAGGQVGFAGHLNIGEGSQIGAQSGIHTDIAPKSKVLGSPAHPYIQSLKIEALKKELPDLFKRVKALEEKM